MCSLNAVGVLARPRKVYELKTQYFDILFSQDSKEVADYLSKNADNLFEKAKKSLNSDANFRMPVVISPDSDFLKVEYTSDPYNRIVIYDAVPDTDFLCFTNALESLFYHEIYSAIAQSKMSKANKFIQKTVGGDKYTPVSLVNLPFSFVEGLFYVEDAADGCGRINDGYFLQILSQAKYEGKFPSWIDIAAVSDNLSFSELPVAAGSAFTAFLINHYGIEKYSELWNECGKLHLYFTAGIFKKVYGKKLTDLWKEFEASVPLPKDLEKLKQFEQVTESLFSSEESDYQFIINTPYGLVWYDAIQHEVDIFDFTSKHYKKLFYASDIERMELSPDGRYLAVSYIGFKHYDVFKKNIVRVYDLEERETVCDELELRDACFVQLQNSSLAVAGVDVASKTADLKVYLLEELNENLDETELIYNKKFERNVIPVNPVYSGIGYLFYIINVGNKQIFRRVDLNSGFESDFVLEAPIKIRNLKCQKKGEKLVYSFEYVSKEDFSFTRMGFFELDSKFIPSKVFFQNGDVSGGVNFAAFVDDKVFFNAKKVRHSELEFVKTDNFEFTESGMLGRAVGLFDYTAPDLSDIDGKIETKELKQYLPFKYMYHLSVMPFLPVKEISMDDGPKMWPGLGITLRTQADPCNNNDLLISAGWDYLKLDFKWAFSVPDDIQELMDLDSTIGNKNKSFAIFFENTSTPVDIKTGAIFRYNLDGEYLLTGMGGTKWTIPIGMNFNKVNMNIQGEYTVSTDYYDSNMINVYESKTDWPSFNDAYSLAEVSAAFEFTNMHQSGSSAFEKCGYTVGLRIYSLWDLYTIQLEEEKNRKNGVTEENPYGDLNITQLNMGLYGKAAIPKINPWGIQNGWIFSFPTSFTLELMNKTGTAFLANIETLFVGREIHKGIAPLYLFFSRIGLRGGYAFYLNYDTQKVELPDIRSANYYDVIIENSYIRNEVYLAYDMDVVIPIGELSKYIINTRFKTSFYPDTKGFTFDLNFEFKF